MEKTDREFSTPSLSSSMISEAEGRVPVKSRSTVSRSFSLGGIGAVSKSAGHFQDFGVCGCDSVTMPPASQKRSKSYQDPEYSKSSSGEHQQAGRGLADQQTSYFHFQPAKRTSTFTSHPPLRPTALHGGVNQRKVRNSTSTMDYMPSPESFCTPDILKSTFNPSPSSLYVYDQDHQSMCSPLLETARALIPQVCTTRDLTTLPPGEPEFDLHPRFENSNNLEGYFGGALGNRITAGSHSETCVDFKNDALKQELMTASPEPSKLKPGPILTELNVDPYLFEDSSSMTLGEGKKTLQPVSTVSRPKVAPEEIKPEISAPIHPDLGPKTFTALTPVKTTSQSPAAIVRMLHQSQSSPSHTSTTSLSELLTKSRIRNASSAIPPTPAATTFPTTIKTEPVETESAPVDSNPCLHKILTSPSHHSAPPLRSPTARSPSSVSPGRLAAMPMVGQGRPPTLGQQGKSGSVEEKWKEIEKFIHNPSTDRPSVSSAYRKRKRHGSGGSPDMSDDESVKSQRIESISDDDSDSDVDSDVSDAPFEESLTELAKKSKQYFWQYNIQAKGPKGTRLQLTINNDDPHRPSNFEDPVFDPTNTSLVGIRHAGKARKGDGNEITPNPRKLYMIGQKLCKLNREINNVQLSGNLPASARNKSRKEKNKLSSRACRLKKKAQHEANKIKLFGLNCEQGELLDVVGLVWPMLRERAKQQMKENIPFPPKTFGVQIDNIIKSHCKTRIAGNTADYVNQAVAKVEEGDSTGGLAIKLKVK